MDINEHFDILINKYNLNYIYKKYIILSILTTAIQESFYWFLIYFSDIIKNDPTLMPKLSIALIGILGLNIPIERHFNHAKTDLIEKIKLANNNYFYDRIINMSKKELLNFNLVEYFNILDHYNENLELYIVNIKKKIDIPIKFITLIIIALNKKFTILISLVIVFCIIVKILNEYKNTEETVLTKDFFKYENIIRNYVINGKHFLINDEFNKKYLIKNFTNYEKVNNDILSLNYDLDMKVNILMFCLIIIVIRLKIHELTHIDFFYYFLIVYDIEFISNMINDYYKTKVYFVKMEERLQYLNSFVPQVKTIGSKTKITNIKIISMDNKIPLLTSNKPITINENDHILVNGESGSGKTTLLYMLKGIVKPDNLNITPPIEDITHQTYLTLSNHKSLYSGNLYDIISNYDNNLDSDLIQYALKKSKIHDKLNKNEFIDIETLSGGERMRLIISRIIYNVTKSNYNILLFDEIDENLNNELAIDICNNLRDVFKDKIILYITHNEKVKDLFTKKIIVKNNMINYNIS